MNREIKFRGKNKDIGWVEGQVAYDLNEDTYIIREVEQDSSYGLEETMLFAIMWYRVDKDTIGQYTGLKDENGKEIYEGDIVLLDCYNYEEPLFSGEFKVIYDVEKGMWLLVDLENKDRVFTFGEIRSYYKAEIEVIGNEVDNTELLGGD